MAPRQKVVQPNYMIVALGQLEPRIAHLDIMACTDVPVYVPTYMHLYVHLGASHDTGLREMLPLIHLANI